MKSKTVKLISGAGVLAVLCGVYAGVNSYVSSQEEKEAEEADVSVSLVDLDQDKITSVSFLAEDGSETVFEKKEDSWIKKEEEDFPVSQDTLEGAVNSLAALDADQELSDPEDLSEYDLDDPQNEITLTLEDGSETVLQVGMENESTGQYYVKSQDDSDKVYLVAGTALEAFMGTAYEFAEAEAFPAVTSATIKDVKVEKEESYQLSQDEDSLYWYISDGKSSEQADTSKAGTVTSTIGSLTYGDFVDYNCTDQAKYGFDDPYAVITATYMEEEDTEADTDATEASEDLEDSETEETSEDSGEVLQEEQQLVIYVGDETEGSRYVKVNDSSQVYTVTEEAMTDILDKGVSDFYSLTVNYLTVNNLDELEILKGDESHTVKAVRTEKVQEDSEETTEETTYALDGAELEETDFTTFYNKLINMAGQERLTDPYTPEQDAEFTFVFRDTDGGETTVSYYQYDASFYAAVVEDKVYLVNKMNVKDLEEAYDTVLNGEETDPEENSEEDSSETSEEISEETE